MVLEETVPRALAAIAAGMRCIGFTGGEHYQPRRAERLLQAGALTVLTGIGELRRALLD